MSKNTVSVFQRIKRGWQAPVKFRVHRAVLYVLTLFSIGFAPNFVTVIFLMALFQSELYFNARSGTSNPNA